MSWGRSGLTGLAAVGIWAWGGAGAFAQTPFAPSQPPAKVIQLGPAPQYTPGKTPIVTPPTQVIPQLALPALSVNTALRRASRNFYNAIYGPSNGVASGWTGNVATGVAGDTAQNFKDAVNLRVNFLRALAGVPAAITFNSTYSADDQLDALMTSANNTLSHTPPNTWIDYTSQGALAASNSNLFIGEYGPDAVTGYVQDPGSNNAEAGHRRWLLYPPTPQMGTGDIPPDGSYSSANSLWVLYSSQATETGLRDGFVAWPPKGYVPYQFIFPRWSFSLQNADFSSAAVTVTLNGVNVPTTIETNNLTGFGDNTVVWNLTSTPDGSPSYPAPAGDQTYSVTVSNVLVSGVAHSYTYPVIVFDPSVPGPDDVLPSLSGPSSVAAGSTTNYTFTTLPEASSYDVLSATQQNVTWVEGAETQPYHLTPQTTGTYSPVTSATSASGSNCFQLCQDGFNNQDLLLNSQFIVSANSSISFQARFGYMTPAQFAQVQVSTDDGQSWANVFSQAGNNADSGSFQLETISLSAYANRLIRIRFLLDYTAGSAYTQTNPSTGPDPGYYFGWLIDNITPANISEATSVAHTTIASSPASFVAPAASTASANVFVVRALLFGSYPVEYGPVQAISVPASTTTFGGSSVGGGWYYSSWFGYYNNFYFPWINTPQLGFMYVSTTDNTNIYLYHLTLGWIYTTPTQFPNVYSFQENTWLYYYTGTNTFYNYTSGKVETH